MANALLLTASGFWLDAGIWYACWTIGDTRTLAVPLPHGWDPFDWR